jgi:hypothetical protein
MDPQIDPREFIFVDKERGEEAIGLSLISMQPV